MTREEAIMHIDAMITTTIILKGIVPDEHDIEALRMAIEALQAQPTHGRLIDAGFEEQHYASMLLNPTPDVTAKDRENAKIILDALKMAKTVQADRSHGEWINREYCQVDEDAYEVATCSNCKSEITIEYPHDNYCPNCGADMRKGEE